MILPFRPDGFTRLEDGSGDGLRIEYASSSETPKTGKPAALAAKTKNRKRVMKEKLREKQPQIDHQKRPHNQGQDEHTSPFDPSAAARYRFIPN
jgi:hypothetical protein